MMRSILNAVDLAALRSRLKAPLASIQGELLELLGDPDAAKELGQFLSGDRQGSRCPEFLDALVAIVGYRPLSVDIPTEDLRSAIESLPEPPRQGLLGLLENRGLEGEPLQGDMQVAFLDQGRIESLHREILSADLEGIDETAREWLVEDIAPALAEALREGKDVFVRSL